MADLSTLLSLRIKFLYVRSDVCLRLPSDSTSRWIPLLSAVAFPLLGRLGDLHPLEYVRAGRTKRNSDEAATSSEFPLSYIRDCSHVDYITVPEILNDTGRKSHVPDCNIPDILHIFLTLKILSREVTEKHLYACSVIAVQDDFPFCLIVSMTKTCFCEYYRRLAQRFLCYFLFPLALLMKESRRLAPPTSQKCV